MIAEGYDVGFRVGEMKDGTMVVRDIAPLHLVVCGAPAYLAKNGAPLKPPDLAGHNCLRLRSRRGPGKAANWHLGPDKVAVAPAVSGNFLSNDITTLVTAAVHGHGLVHAPLPLVIPLFRTRALVPVLADWISQPARIFIHYPNRKHLPERVRTFVKFMLDRLRSNPDLTSDPKTLIAPYLRR